jgi:hypothetical protein
MAIRTVQLLGQGYGQNPSEITVFANGTTVFSGAIPTLNLPVPSLPNFDLIDTMTVLCSFEIDTSFSGSIPMTCQVIAGTTLFANILANYTPIANPAYSPAQLQALEAATTQAERVVIFEQVANPPLSQEDIDTLLSPTSTPEETSAILIKNNCKPLISSGPTGYRNIDTTDNITDPRSNVVINGVTQTPDRIGLPGTWWWAINEGSTFAYSFNVSPAMI